jgi:5-methylcytosine-specific restriction enzyme B
VFVQRCRSPPKQKLKLKMSQNTKILQLIADYKVRLNETQLKDELYKWELIAAHQGKPNLDAEDFAAEMKNVHFGNLIYQLTRMSINHLATHKPKEYRTLLKMLFNENIELTQRIGQFKLQIEPLFHGINANKNEKNSQHDERAMASFLTYFNPQKYTFYKDSFYQNFCDLIGEKPEKTLLKYAHYLKLLQVFITDYVQKDSELIHIIDELTQNTGFKDENRLLLAQDILFQMLENQTNNFENVIALLEEKCKESDSILNGFTFHKIQQNQKWVWISDSFSKIGSTTLVKYEIALGKIKNHYTVDIYFESSENKHTFFKTPPVLNKKLLWYDAFEPQNIRVKDPVSKSSPSLVQKLYEQLLFLEENIGDQIRASMDPHFENNTEIIIQKPKNTMSQNLPLNKILFGPPGTGKTYNTINAALEILGEELEGKDRADIKQIFDEYVKSEQIQFCTFHQSMSYEDFVEGIKPETNEEGNVVYEIQDGIFKKMAIDAQFIQHDDFETAYQKLLDELYELPDGELLKLETPTKKVFGIGVNTRGNLSLHTGLEFKKQGVLTKKGVQMQMNGEQYYKDWLGYFEGVIQYLKTKYGFSTENSDKSNEKPYVLIIDEINRGNVSQIFGELITLIEDDKRLGAKEALTVTLPYSKKAFGVPQNLYILGTMNTADRSVEALDSALRRRFEFQEMPPQPELLAAITIENIDFIALLDKINARLTALLSKDHTIGHAFFINCKTIKDVERAFYNKIIPLLQEYFYGDLERIAWVIGSDFVEIKESDKGLFLNNLDLQLPKQIGFVKPDDFVAALKNI